MTELKETRVVENGYQDRIREAIVIFDNRTVLIRQGIGGFQQEAGISWENGEAYILQEGDTLDSLEPAMSTILYGGDANRPPATELDGEKIKEIAVECGLSDD